MDIHETDPSPLIAGFWRRLGAFALDGIFLGIIGLAAGFLFTPVFVNLGAAGRLVGFAVALAYFGLLNSRLTNGQTPGKRLLKIRVVTSDHTPLSVTKSFLRFIPLGAPWFMNNACAAASPALTLWHYIASVVAFGIGLSIVYLYVFNRRTRQSLHDLLAGTFVVASSVEGRILSSKPWRMHWAACTVLLLVSGVAPLVLGEMMASEPLASMTSLYRAVVTEPSVVSATIARGRGIVSSARNGRSEVAYLNLIAHVNTPDIGNVEIARHLARLAIATDAAISAVDVVRVTLVYGYDIGIASSWRSQTYAHSPQEWSAQ